MGNDERGVRPPRRHGMFRRLRRLPGSRTAAAAFVLTVALGLGAPAAYAWWSQQGSAAITVTAGKPTPTPTPTPEPTPTSAPTPTPTPPTTAPEPLPVTPTALTCSRPASGGPNNGGRQTSIAWTANAAPSGSYTVVDIVLKTKNGQAQTATRSYAVPGTSGTVLLAALPGIEPFLADAQGNNTKFDVAVRNAWLSSAVTSPTLLGGKVTIQGTPSAPLTYAGFQYKENGDWFNCPHGIN